MSDPLNIVWLDDDPDRKTEADNLMSRLDAMVEFEDAKGKLLSNMLNKILEKPEPDLILLDHMLSNVDFGVIKRGSSVAEIIREKWPKCPIVCVTAIQLKDIDRHKKSIYEDIFEFDNISSYDSTLDSIARSFQMLRRKPPKNEEQFIKLLEAPEEDKESLLSVLPIKGEIFKDDSLFMSISRWVRNELMGRPGFLYDRLWAATFLGLNEKGFKKIEADFADAKYNGIFADKSKERWWTSKLRELLFLHTPDSDLLNPWERGRDLQGVKSSDFSKCHVSGEDFPETVAFTDEVATPKNRFPMRLRYTVLHPNFNNSLYFEEIRMMAGKK